MIDATEIVRIRALCDEPSPCSNGDCRAARTALPALLDEVERLQKENKRLREAEFEARKMADDCQLCPHLGVGDPLVDEQAREVERLRACVEEIVAMDAKERSQYLDPNYYDKVGTLSAAQVRAIIARHGMTNNKGGE